MLFIVGEFRIRSARRGVTIEVLSFWFMLFDGHDGAHQLSGGEHDDIIMMCGALHPEVSGRDGIRNDYAIKVNALFASYFYLYLKRAGNSWHQ